jgi:hypothetical protein
MRLPGRESGKLQVMSTTMHTVGAPPQPSGEVRFRREGNRLCVDHATPVMWFAHHVLEHSRADPDVGLSFDGTHVTLHASNGRWIWKLTGRSRCHSRGPDAEPLVMVEGIWPD